MDNMVNKITGEGEVSGLPEFDFGAPSKLLTDENDERFDTLYNELIDPLVDAYDVSNRIDPDEIVGLASSAVAGKIHAYSMDSEFVVFLKVPLEQWHAAVAELTKRLAG